MPDARYRQGDEDVDGTQRQILRGREADKEAKKNSRKKRKASGLPHRPCLSIDGGATSGTTVVPLPKSNLETALLWRALIPQFWAVAGS